MSILKKKPRVEEDADADVVGGMIDEVVAMSGEERLLPFKSDKEEEKEVGAHKPYMT